MTTDDKPRRMKANSKCSGLYHAVEHTYNEYCDVPIPCTPVGTPEPELRTFKAGDRVRLIPAPDVEGVVVERNLVPNSTLLVAPGFVSVRWDGRISVADTHVRSIELVPAPSEPKQPEASPQEAEIAIGMAPYREWSASLNTAKIDASNSFKVKSMIDYAREIPATAPFASLIFDLANFLEDATKDNLCTGAFCARDTYESCELCGRAQGEHVKCISAPTVGMTSKAEVEMVARAIAVAATKTPNYWTWYNDMALAAIRAMRGLHAEPTQ